MTHPAGLTAGGARELRAALAVTRPWLVRASWFSVLAALLVLVPSIYMFQVYGRVVESRSAKTLLMLTLVVVGAYVVLEVLEWARVRLLRGAGLALEERLRRRVFDAVFDGQVLGVPGATQQAFTDLALLRDFFFSPAMLAVMEAPVALLLAFSLFLISPWLGSAALLFALLQVGVTWFNERATQPPLSEATRSAIAAQRYADGALREAEVIEAMGMLHNLHARWLGLQRKFLDLQGDASLMGGALQAVSRMLQQLLGSVMLGLGCLLLLYDDLLGGPAMMIIGSILGGRMLAPLVGIVMQWKLVVNVRDAWTRLVLLLSAVPERGAAMPLPPPRGAVAVEQLVAGAPGSAAPILRGLNFALQPGEVLAVVGPSASGKTTLARLMVGLWAPLTGKVRLDGADIHGWDKDEVGRHIGYLPQSVELIEGTVAENIARFGELDLQRVEQAARAVDLHETILALPGGYDCRVGPGGARLSGGQRQRVALARAFYGEPNYLVLDEPNSSLDEAGEAALATAIAEASARGATVVVVTHRTSILKVATRLLVLRDGAQQLFGPRDEVLAALSAAQRQPGLGGAPTGNPVLAA